MKQLENQTQSIRTRVGGTDWMQVKQSFDALSYLNVAFLKRNSLLGLLMRQETQETDVCQVNVSIHVSGRLPRSSGSRRRTGPRVPG